MRTLSGLSLIELLLVFAIMSSISLLGLRFYQTIQQDADISEVKQRVDLLFSATDQYYKANCMIPYDPTSDTYPSGGIYLSGRLDPRFNPPIEDGATWVLSIQNNLQSTSTPASSDFLSTPYPFMPLSSLTDNTNLNNTFVVQLTRHDIPFNHINRQSQGIAVHWDIQVSVLLNPKLINTSEQAQGLRASLGADCLATIKAGSGTGEINTCQTPSANGPYAVWKKTPAEIMQNNSKLNLKHFNLIQFKSLYTVAPSRLIPVGQQNYLLCSS